MGSKVASLKRHPFLALGFLSVVLTGAMWAALTFQPLEKYDQIALDYFFVLRGERLQNRKKDEMPPAVVVGLDVKTLKQIGRWPWPRGVLARLMYHLCAGEPSTVALDILLDRPTRDYSKWFYQPDKSFDPKKQDAMLAHALGSCPAPVLAELHKFGVGGKDEALGPYKTFLPQQGRIGYVNLPVSALDQRIRKFKPVWLDEKTGKLRLSFAVQAYVAHQRLKPEEVKLEGRTLWLGKTAVPLDRRGEVWINWRGTPLKKGEEEPLGVISAWTLMENEDPEMARMISAMLLEGKAVFVGLTDPEEKDVFTTPYSISPEMTGWQTIGGVRVHQEAALTLLDQAFLREVNPAVMALVFLPAIVLLLFAFTKNHVAGALTLTALAGTQAVVGQTMFNQYSLLTPVVTPGVMLFVSALIGMVYRLLVVDKEKRQTSNLLKSYVAPHVVAELMKNPEDLGLGGKKSEVTVLFSDVRGFTTMSEMLDPHQMVEALNLYLDRMTQTIFENNGMVDKFIGDAVMAVWGAPKPSPDDRVNAIRAALGMNRALKELNPRIKEIIGMEFHVGVGINSGMVTLGNIGSKNKLDYTVIGDSVNLASRLESKTKDYGVQLIVSENALKGLEDRFYWRLLDLVIVKGKTEPVKIYEVLAER